MVLSPADFDAYSRATGRPVPEDQEERGRLVPEVREYRSNQLKLPETRQQQGSGLLEALGIGAALLGGGALLAGALGRKGGVRMGNAQQAAKEAVQNVNVRDVSDVYRAAGRPAPSKPAPTAAPSPQPSPTPRPAGSRQGGVSLADLSRLSGTEPKGLLRGRQPGGAITQFAPRGELTDLSITEVPVVDITTQVQTPKPSSGKDFIAGYFKQSATPAGYLTEAEVAPINDRADELLQERELNRQRDIARRIRAQDATIIGKGERLLDQLLSESRAGQQPVVAVEQVVPESLVAKQQTIGARVADQTANAIDAAEDQMTGRIKSQLQRNEDLDLSQIEVLEEMTEQNRQWMMEQDEPINQVASQLPDGLPVDQAEGLKVLDLRNKQSFQILPRQLGQQQNESQLLNQARQYLLSKEIDTDFDYSTENKIQAAQVQDRIQKAQYLREQADQILADIKAESQPQAQQVSPQEFAAQFNKKYKEELNDQLRDVDNARQRAELKAAQSGSLGEDIESLLQGEAGEIDVTIRGKALRGGKPNITGGIVYQDDAGNFVSADTGLKTRQAQGPEFKARAELLNQLRFASDEELTSLIAQSQNALANRKTISKLDADATRFASQVLQNRALNNPEPTRLQLDALDRARASITASQQALQGTRNQRPTVAPGPAQDVARAMETLRRGMLVDPSEPLPKLPSVNQLRTGYAADEELEPILGASDVYTGAAAQAAGPVIFTGKSKANSVIQGPRITGSVKTPVGSYLTQDNPDVLGTVYKVAGTPANRAISAQIEANAQAFLADALAGGLQPKVVTSPETFVTHGSPSNFIGPRQPQIQGPSISPLRFVGTLGLPGQEASQRTNYSQYQPGRSAATPLSPFIGEMTGGTVVVAPPSNMTPVTRRDIGAPPGSRLDLTRRGEKTRYFSIYPQETFVTGLEPAPIGPLTQSPGLSLIGGMQRQTLQGAGGVYITQLTPQGQKIAYPRMDKPVMAEGFRGGVVTNIPKYGIDPGAEDWRNDLMRSAFRRGGPIRTYQT